MLPLIVVLEPDANVRKTLVRLLRGDALRITAAGTLAQARANVGPARPELVIADVRAANGFDAADAKAIEQLWPGVTVIWMSGGAAQGPAGAVVLRKPFARAALVAVVQQALADRNGADR